MNTLLLAIAFVLTPFFGQVPATEIKPLKFDGQVKVNSLPCDNATISICRLGKDNGECETSVYNLTTGKNGKFDFQLEPDANYRMDVKKNGFVDRFVLIDTSMPEERTGDLKPFTFEIQLSLYADANEVPVQAGSIYFDSVKNRVDYRIGTAK